MVLERLRGAASASGGGDAVEAAYRWCRDYTRAHQENFTVVSWVLPARLRPHFHAVYAYCRWTDDLGDEAEGDRLALLDAWERNLRACYDGRREQPLFVALGATIDRFDIPADPFLRLIEANRMDQRITRFETYSGLLHYCEHSATPVGRMVLAVLGYSDSDRQALSDATCTGLQLANFWQDVSVDIAQGRIYLPLEDLRRYGVSEGQIERREVTPAFQRLIRFEVDRAQELFERGRQLEPLIDRAARADVRLFREGGEAILEAIRRAHYDTLSARPAIPRAKKAALGLTAGARIRLGL